MPPDGALGELRSCWQVPAIAHFCSLFRAAFQLPDFEIKVVDARGGPNLKAMRIRPKKIRPFASRRHQSKQVAELKSGISSLYCGASSTSPEHSLSCSNHSHTDTDTELCIQHRLRLLFPTPRLLEKGVTCSVLNSNCIDSSWIHPRQWTPSAPSNLEVVLVIEANESGDPVPVLRISWTVAPDASILGLLGAEVSVMQRSTNEHLCVQLQFENQFPQQLMSDNKPWQFVFSNFKVDPDQMYDVTVQHLPRLVNSDLRNSKEMSIIVPGCRDKRMSKTKTCCQHGDCWDPNISAESDGDDLVVSFDTRSDSCDYRILVKNTFIVSLRSPQYPITLHPDNCSERMNHTFTGLAADPLCWYFIQVWAVLPTCKTDCIRYNHMPQCSTTSPPPVSNKRLRLFFIPAAFIILLAPILIICLDDSKTEDSKPALDLTHPDVRVKKVWLVYSADSRRYLDVVIKFADFLRDAWGMEVVLDRCQVNNIGLAGAATWLNHQKAEIEKVNGTILLLCSRGTQEKWLARQNYEGNKVVLRENRHLFSLDQGDLFSCTLNFIIPDFEMNIQERYVVAYFGDLSSIDNIPSLFKMCPQYCIPQDLQDVFFRIHRIEQCRPGVKVTAPQQQTKSYGFLMQALNKCKVWQDEHPDWFQKQCLPNDGVESDHEDEDISEGLTQQLKPLVHIPNCSISMMNPVIAKPLSTMVTDPIIAEGLSSLLVQPHVHEGGSSVQTWQPILMDGQICRQDLHLNPPQDDSVSVGEHYSSPLSDQGYLSLDLLREEHMKLLMQLPQSDLLEIPEEEDYLRLEQVKHSEQPDQGYITWDSMSSLDRESLMAAQVKLLQQSGVLE
ncbi:interleukin-17 receptor A-like isoform X4 [Xenopus laevis]|uniref:Interleukin-17 receptor A-like isoform X4 n=1 Tax=Xenopus laevis TaxID=8355 RepID=A0A8J1MHN2_XENLA|nr:interleukin-17 receptor A-like isoform X4 [Xenopus laevis]